ncbi:hypothetical protein SAMN05443575_0855 [Jatrophihabitans endophyticus]|uniref:Uncharacterized protein n=1 Tax=Jatrophihabitans endophyticus TaxID=1206085 RepID=A0A1M5ED59_9ACTN|nr:hypothetical protein [Jatrophihabitans endophyticus]SHF77032.1 hypothetical protein SAMN05443575_0855 [Jatrophihabitans endophyticus]
MPDLPTDTYVTNAAWTPAAQASRPDVIDDVADQFERPAAGAETFWSQERAVAWPRSSRGWRGDDAARLRAAS